MDKDKNHEPNERKTAMRNKTLLATILGLCSLLLLAVGGGIPLHALAQQPGDVCTCTNIGPSWPTNNACPGSGQLCSQLGLINDSLACGSSIFPADCPLTGSVTVAYDSCTQAVCVEELHVNCSPPGQPPCPANTAPVVLQDGQTYSPTVPVCCVDPTSSGCLYRFRVTFWNPGPCGTGTLHCEYWNEFNCFI